MISDYLPSFIKKNTAYFVLRGFWSFFKNLNQAWLVDGRMINDMKSLYVFYKQNIDVVFYCEKPVHSQWINSTIKQMPSNIGWVIIADYQGDESNLTISKFGVWFIRTKVLVSAVSAPIFPKWSAPYRVHMPHSLVSFHMIYFVNSFDNYNFFFCCGEHHINEINKIAQVRGIKGVMTEKIGYGKLDLLCEEVVKAGEDALNVRPIILLAPSWGKKNILESIGLNLVKALVSNGFDVVIRPHPNFLTHKAYLKIIKEFENSDSVNVEDSNEKSKAMFYADIMISDYSGVAFEYAFLRNKPVVFVNVPKKINNPDWDSYQLDPMEVYLRDKVGVVVDNGEEQVVSGVKFLIENEMKYRNEIELLKTVYAFNFGECGVVAGKKIVSLVSK